MTNLLMGTHKGRAGVWVVYDYGNDGGVDVMSIHIETTKAIEALRNRSYGKIAFIPFGEEVKQAIADWENDE